MFPLASPGATYFVIIFSSFYSGARYNWQELSDLTAKPLCHLLESVQHIVNIAQAGEEQETQSKVTSAHPVINPSLTCGGDKSTQW